MEEYQEGLESFFIHSRVVGDDSKIRFWHDGDGGIRPQGTLFKIVQFGP